MKNAITLLAVSCLFISATSSALAQGSLTPPGPPAPTMKTLDQVEPRRAITNLPFGIGAPGSYYVVSNLTGVASLDGIQILSSDVTVDLNGFTLTGVPGSFYGVDIPGAYTNICIKNGTLKNWPTAGVEASSATRCRFSDLQIIRSTFGGLSVGTAATVERCGVFDCGAGIFAYESCRITDCQSISNHSDAISATKAAIIERCIARNNFGNGIIAFQGARVKDCVSDGNGGDGIFTFDSSIVESCTAFNNGTHGISIGKFSRLLNSSCYSNGTFSIEMGGGSLAQGCIAAYGSLGYYLNGGSVLQDCSAIGNSGDGISFINGSSSVQNCTVRSNNYGIMITSVTPGTVSGTLLENNRNGGINVNGGYAVITGNTARSNGIVGGFGGFIINASNCRVEGNTATGNTGSGFFANNFQNTNNLFIRNSASANSAGNFNISPTNHFAIANSFNLATNTNPHVNFSH